MKGLFLVAVFSFFVVSAQAQITNDKMNIVYRGIPNPMSFGFFGYPCKSVYVTVDTGTITLFDGADYCGSMIYNAPANGSMATFRVYAKTKKGPEKIWESRFRIKDIPNPEAFVSGRRNTEIPANALKIQTGMVAHLIGFDGEVSFRIDSFNYAIIRDEKIVATGKNISAFFDKKIKMYFSATEDKDTILFFNIVCHGPDKRSRKLESFELAVTK